MKFLPSSLATLPVLLLSSFLTLGPTPIQAANGPSHFVISTPSTNSPWQADGVNPLAWTYSKSESVSQAVDQGKGGNQKSGRGRARRVSLTVVTSVGSEDEQRWTCSVPVMQGGSSWMQQGVGMLHRKRMSGGEGTLAHKRGGAAILVRHEGGSRTTDLSLCFLPLAADILQFDVELLRLSGTGLLLVAKNGAFFPSSL